MFGQFPKRIRAFMDFEKEGLDSSMSEVSKYASGLLLDVGCGDKPYESILGPGLSGYVGLEYSESHEGSMNEASGAADMLYDGKRIPPPDESVDIVLCTQVLEHVPDPSQLMREMARVLRVGGNLIVTAPFSYRLHAEPDDYWRFTWRGLEHLLQESGLRPERIESRGGFWKVIGLSNNWHLLVKICRLQRLAQEVGAYGYLACATERPRYWLLPLAVLVALTARLLESLDHDRSMVLRYTAVGVKERSQRATMLVAP